jgi:hypothetical protein
MLTGFFHHSVSEIKDEAIDTLLRWGAPEPLLPNELRIIEQSLVRMHVDMHARTPETRQLGAQSAAIYLKYNPVRRGVAEATRINPMQACADRLTAMLPVRAAPKGAAAWSDVLHALLTHTGNPALAEGFVARLAASPPSDTQLLHWSAQDVFSFRVTEHHWCTINFRVGVIQIADLNPAHGERADLPLIREASAPITVDWAVALKKVRWPASESPPRLLD